MEATKVKDAGHLTLLAFTGDWELAFFLFFPFSQAFLTRLAFRMVGGDSGPTKAKLRDPTLIQLLVHISSETIVT